MKPYYIALWLGTFTLCLRLILCFMKLVIIILYVAVLLALESVEAFSLTGPYSRAKGGKVVSMSLHNKWFKNAMPLLVGGALFTATPIFADDTPAYTPPSYDKVARYDPLLPVYCSFSLYLL